MKFRLLIAVALFVTACSGTADAGEGVASLEVAEPGATDVTEEMSAEEAAIAFTACMRENGVDMEDPTVDADGNVTPGRPLNLPEPGEGQADDGAREEIQGAFEACGEFLDGAAFGFGQIDQTELQDQLIELAACLRDQGVDVADPDLSDLGPGGTPGEGGPFGIDFQDPEVEAALDQCEDLLPNVGRGFGGGGPGGGGGGRAGGGNA